MLNSRKEEKKKDLKYLCIMLGRKITFSQIEHEHEGASNNLPQQMTRCTSFNNEAIFTCYFVNYLTWNNYHNLDYKI